MTDKIWYPPIQEGFWPWFEYDGSGMPVDADVVTHVLTRTERLLQFAVLRDRPAIQWNWSHNQSECEAAHQIVAYCVEK